MVDARSAGSIINVSSIEAPGPHRATPPRGRQGRCPQPHQDGGARTGAARHPVNALAPDFDDGGTGRPVARRRPARESHGSAGACRSCRRDGRRRGVSGERPELLRHGADPACRRGTAAAGGGGITIRATALRTGCCGLRTPRQHPSKMRVCCWYGVVDLEEAAQHWGVTPARARHLGRPPHRSDLGLSRRRRPSRAAPPRCAHRSGIPRPRCVTLRSPLLSPPAVTTRRDGGSFEFVEVPTSRERRHPR